MTEALFTAASSGTWTPDFTLVHVGINAEDMASAQAIADAFAGLFQWNVRATVNSVFSGEAVEAMAGCGRGVHGHIGVGTHDIAAAVAWLRAQGVELLEETFVKNPFGKYGAIYLKQPIGGFAVHLVEL